MKRPRLLICLSILLVLSIALNCFLLFKYDTSDLGIYLARPLSFEEDGSIASSYTISLENREQTEIILLSFLNAQPIPEEEAPTALPDGAIMVRYQGTAYPYRIWFHDDHIIIANNSNAYRKIQNDHNNPVPLIKELIESIDVTLPG